MRLVIDTNIWVKALTDLPHYKYDCESFLIHFVDGIHSLVVDYKWEILKEYDDNLKAFERYRIFYTMLEKTGRISFTDTTIPSKHIKKLNELHFHEKEDQIFTGAAYNTDKCIVTEDSDYGKGTEEKSKIDEKQAVLRYMQEEMNLKIYDASEAKRELVEGERA
ncbi:MAG: PIN domain-containing protein [Ruminiclostridium sp.]|nr:PIN domain-containing protein [Ruminiclostridium sp.]